MKKIQLLSVLLLMSSGVFSQAYFSHFKTGETKFNAEDYSAAIEAFTKVVELKADHDRALNYRGLCYEKIGDFESASKDYNLAIGIKPKVGEYHSNLGHAYFKLKKYDDAISTLAVAIDRDKKNLAGKLRFILPTAIGQSEINDDVSEEMLQQIL